MTNPLQNLAAFGQAVWLDFLHRRMLEDGGLGRLIERDGLTGLTSNPSIFEKAIGDGDSYDAALRSLIDAADAEAIDLYESLAIADIQVAADALRPLWDSVDGRDGFVSLEVSPYLALDTAATIAEGRRLWRAVDRPNLMIKVPGTAPGIPAIRALIGEGINVNVTLLFSVQSYAAAADAHLSGLEDFAAAGGAVSRVHGVASLFVSRIDSIIDKAIDDRLGLAPPDEAAALRALRGKVAIANAKIAYQHFLELTDGPRWRALARSGAAPQRLLWASTGVKDPAYSDVLYVETLIGPQTVNTMPPATMDAFRDHGTVRATLTENVAEAREVLAETTRLGLNLRGVTESLVAAGVSSFTRSFDQLLAAVAGKRAAILEDRMNSQAISPGDLGEAMAEAVARASDHGWVRRLWAGDASLWTGRDEASWLGWLAATPWGGGRRRGPGDLQGRRAFGGLRPCPAARHGRLQPGSGGSRRDPSPRPRPSRTSGARLHRPGPGAPHRGPDRPGQNAVHRRQQIRLHPRAGRSPPLLLRPRRKGPGRRPGRRTVRGHHRPGFPTRGGGRPTGLLARVPWLEIDRRPLLGAVQFRHGPRRRHRPRCAGAAGAGRHHGPRLRTEHGRPPPIRPSLWAR